MRDFIFKPTLDEKGDVDRTRLKKEIAGVLGDRMVDGRASYLFSAEPLVDFAGEWYRLRTTHDRSVPGMREIPAAPVKNGERVTLSAWIAVDENVFRKGEGRDRLAGRCREWLAGVCEKKFGPSLDGMETEVSENIRIMSARSKGSVLKRPYGHVSVTGVVTDASGIEEILRNGIGNARAYGFGLVAIHPTTQGGMS